MAKRLTAPERRASIIEAAKKLFADHGFHGVSIDEIVKHVGVSPAILYRHFKSKDELYNAVLMAYSGQRESYVDAVIKSTEDFEEVLRNITMVFMESMSVQPELLKMELHSMLEGHDAHREFFYNRWKTFTDYIEFSLEELMSSGSIQKLDTRVAALIYQGMLREALLFKHLQISDRMQEYSLTDIVDKMITQFINSLGLCHK